MRVAGSVTTGSRKRLEGVFEGVKFSVIRKSKLLDTPVADEKNPPSGCFKSRTSSLTRTQRQKITRFIKKNTYATLYPITLIMFFQESLESCITGILRSHFVYRYYVYIRVRPPRWVMLQRLPIHAAAVLSVAV